MNDTPDESGAEPTPPANPRGPDRRQRDDPDRREPDRRKGDRRRPEP